MTMYCFSQQTGGENRWRAALATDRDRIIAEDKPEFITVLDVDSSFEDELTLEELQAVKYQAPYGFYVDFDSLSIAEALANARLFIVKLETEYGFNPEQARYYFTGSKGVHIEIPFTVFLARIPPQGIAGLPYIFREMALKLYVDTLDLRVYSGRRGRMWRVPNIKRANGKFKVQVTYEELMTCEVEDYDRIVSAPRAPIPTEPPVTNPQLAYLYSTASDKYAVDLKRKKKDRDDTKELERFRGEWPDAMYPIMEGMGVSPNVGWNQIAIQLSTLACCLGKDEDALIEACQGLIDAHEGDSKRYDTPLKREREMRNLFRYVDGNPAYRFSLGGLFSIFAKGQHRGDLESGEMPAEPDEDEDYDGEGGDEGAQAEGEDDAECRISGHIRWTKRGLYVKTDEVYRQVSNLGMSKPVRLMRLDTGEAIGYELTLHVGGTEVSSFVTMNNFASRQAMNNWASRWSVSVQAQDSAVSALVDLLRVRTERNKRVMYTVSREGLDLVALPGITSEDEYQIIYAERDRVISTGDTAFRFRGMHSPEGAFKSDLLNAPALEDTPEMREFLDHLFEINTDENLGKIMGWFTAAFLCQPIRKASRMFPMLQVYGESGAGKSKTMMLLANMHYYMQDPKRLSSSGNTQFPIIAAVTQSASLPVIFEEFKPREMARYQRDILTNIFRNNYDGSRIERGSLSKDAGQKEIVVNGFDNVAPVAFMGEAIEGQTAIMERCVIVPLSKAARAGRSEHFEFCNSRPHMLGSLGHALVREALALNFKSLRDALFLYRKGVREDLGDEMFEKMERPVHNIVVVAIALDFLSRTLSTVFGDRYSQRIKDMKVSVLSNIRTHMPEILDETSKVLNVMAQLTRVNDVQHHLEKNQDYTCDGKHLDLKLRPAFAKYVRYQRSLGMEILFDSDEAFRSAMSKYAGTVATKCPDNPALYHNPFEPIFRISVDHLEKLGIEPFGNVSNK